MISNLLWYIIGRLTDGLTYAVRSILWGSFLFSVAYSFGWVQRLLWFVLEQTATQLWNGTPVTIGSLEVDLIRGRLWATNVVIHTPRREEWQWESPLICRIGRVYVEHNWISSFLGMLIKMACGQGQKQILEIYTLEVQDCQVFIERKQHIFNFYLMDPWMELPDPKEILEEEKDTTRQPADGQSQQQQQPGNASEEQKRKNDTQSEASVDLNIIQDNVEVAFGTGRTTEFSDATKNDLLEGDEDDVIAHRQAQQLVDDMFSAVKSIGRTATQQKGVLDRGSIASQLASKLKQFKGTKNKTEVMQEGVKVIRQVSQAVAKKTKDMKNVMPKVPNRREPDLAPVFARFGRVIIQDGRIFTRTVSPKKASGAASVMPNANGSSDPPLPPRDSKDDGKSRGDRNEAMSGATLSSHGLGSKWNKPIGISEIVLRSSELCPPNFLMDEKGLPAIYQPLDKIVDVVMKRALVGLAKSNTARFFQTAMGELLEMEYSTIFGGENSNLVGDNRPQYRRSATTASEPNV